MLLFVTMNNNWSYVQCLLIKTEIRSVFVLVFIIFSLFIYIHVYFLISIYNKEQFKKDADKLSFIKISWMDGSIKKNKLP